MSSSQQDYKLNTIEDITLLSSQIINKRNDFFNLAKSQNLPKDLASKIKYKLDALPVSIFSLELVSDLVDSTIDQIRSQQNITNRGLISISDTAAIVGTSYIIFGDIYSLCKRRLIAQLVLSDSWTVDSSSSYETKLIAPKHQLFSLLELEEASKDSIINSDKLKTSLISQDEQITEINRYIRSFTLYQG